jgi:hypothetical protein
MRNVVKRITLLFYRNAPAISSFNEKLDFAGRRAKNRNSPFSQTIPLRRFDSMIEYWRAEQRKLPG